MQNKYQKNQLTTQITEQVASRGLRTFETENYIIVGECLELQENCGVELTNYKVELTEYKQTGTLS